MNGLDLFSGIGGIAEALSPWVETVAYCENDQHAQAVLLSRMSRGEIHTAPIWDDVTTLRGSDLPEINIISGGFPCQDISNAGNKKGLGGERSGLFGEIIRLSSEIRPQFIFLENVSAITIRGLSAVAAEISGLRYDCRWGLLSAYDMGAPHIRERWWLLANSKREGELQSKGSEQKKRGRISNGCENMADSPSYRRNGKRSRGAIEKRLQPRPKRPGKLEGRFEGRGKIMGDTTKQRLPIWSGGEVGQPGPLTEFERSSGKGKKWEIERDFCGVAHGVSHRGDRIRALGNSVVPQCAREAFKRLMGLK